MVVVAKTVMGGVGVGEMLLLRMRMPRQGGWAP
jgi:hypothetical protein